MTSRAFELLQRGGIALAFGMEWFPLLGEHVQGQARALARRRNATHRVIATGGAASVGLLRIRRRGAGKMRLCSAAAVFAALHPAGTVAAVLLLPNGRLWLVAVHEGAVMTRADQLHDDQAGVRQAIEFLRQAYPGLVVHDEGRVSAGLLDDLFKGAQDGGALQPMSSLAARPLVMVFTTCLLLAGGVAFSPFRQLLPGMGARPDVQVVDPALAWREAVAASAQRHMVHGVAGLQAVLDTLHDVPVSLAGWLLTQVECRPGGGQWHCSAQYRREGASDNQGFINAALPGWNLSFDPMEEAVATWAVAIPALPLGDVRLQGAQYNEARLVSTLQALLPAFSEFRLDASQPLPIATPLDVRQLPVPRPAGISAYQRRAVHLQAPLRSLSVLLPETMHMSWERIRVRFAVVDQPTLRSSSLRVSMSGVLYEIDDAYRPASSSAAGATHGLHHGGRAFG